MSRFPLAGQAPTLFEGSRPGALAGHTLWASPGETGGALAGKVDLLLNVPSSDPQRIQEAHITIGHIACSLIEKLVLM